MDGFFIGLVARLRGGLSTDFLYKVVPGEDQGTCTVGP